MATQDPHFQHIAPRCGGKREAFEELCCQLAGRTLHADASYTRLHGAGGDGGVECFADTPEGHRLGWQAKYVFDVDALIAQASESLKTALEVHPTLTNYTVCFPFDLTGPTKRKGRSGQEKFREWQEQAISYGCGSIGGSCIGLLRKVLRARRRVEMGSGCGPMAERRDRWRYGDSS